MIHAADYRRRAEDCAKRANEAQDDYHRKNFLKLADIWTQMAEKEESRAPLLARLGVRKPARPANDDTKALTEALETIRAAGSS
ncbi:MAG: hypothetical protein KF794_05120 [Xanthobacteraceae bacterium]|nr:hypothetical protein [Xanthobacteraceae bacterium]QYK46076.1 MAG: hypothetical protein KF794_05120 [Xanthobacteraceae bacterium]